MKAEIALASVLLGYSRAQTVVTTDNECWLGQGGSYLGSCSDVYFFTCDEYEVVDSCNIYTFSDSRITWSASDVSVHVWEYYLSAGQDQNLEISGSNFTDGVCYPISEVPTVYEHGLVMNFTGGMCGFRYQVTNSNEEDGGFTSKFKVMKDNASRSLFVGSGVLSLAVLFSL